MAGQPSIPHIPRISRSRRHHMPVSMLASLATCSPCWVRTRQVRLVIMQALPPPQLRIWAVCSLVSSNSSSESKIFSAAIEDKTLANHAKKDKFNWRRLGFILFFLLESCGFLPLSPPPSFYSYIWILPEKSFLKLPYPPIQNILLPYVVPFFSLPSSSQLTSFFVLFEFLVRVKSESKTRHIQ